MLLRSSAKSAVPSAMGLALFALAAGLLLPRWDRSSAALAQRTPCRSSTVQAKPTHRPPPLVRQLVDPRRDFLLGHLLFERVHRVRISSFEVIPRELDLLGADVSTTRSEYVFRIRTDGSSLARIWRSAPRTVQFGIYIDRDFKGASDLLLTTTEDERVVALDPDLRMIRELPPAALEGGSLTLRVPRDLLPATFDWVVFSAYSPSPTAFFASPTRGVTFVPIVDLMLDTTWRHNVEVHSAYSGTSPCQVYQSQYHSCPAPGGPFTDSVPGTSYQGVLISQKTCGERGYALWCINQSFFGKRVLPQQGWVARCPYLCGQNVQQDYDQNSDGVPDVLMHTVTDAPCTGMPTGPMKRMEHTYTWATNQVRSCQVLVDSGGNEMSRQCKPDVPPYSDPGQVPGSVP